MVKTIADGIIEEAQIEYARKMMLKQGTILIGRPSEETESAIRAITDLERLDRMLETIVHAKSWPELLAIE